MRKNAKEISFFPRERKGNFQFLSFFLIIMKTRWNKHFRNWWFRIHRFSHRRKRSYLDTARGLLSETFIFTCSPNSSILQRLIQVGRQLTGYYLLLLKQLLKMIWGRFLSCIQNAFNSNQISLCKPIYCRTPPETTQIDWDRSLEHRYFLFSTNSDWMNCYYSENNFLGESNEFLLT